MKLTDLTVKLPVTDIVDNTGRAVQKDRTNEVRQTLNGDLLGAEAGAVGRHRQTPG